MTGRKDFTYCQHRMCRRLEDLRTIVKKGKGPCPKWKRVTPREEAQRDKHRPPLQQHAKSSKAARKATLLFVCLGLGLGKIRNFPLNRLERNWKGRTCVGPDTLVNKAGEAAGRGQATSHPGCCHQAQDEYDTAAFPVTTALQRAGTPLGLS